MGTSTKGRTPNEEGEDPVEKEADHPPLHHEPEFWLMLAALLIGVALVLVYAWGGDL